MFLTLFQPRVLFSRLLIPKPVLSIITFFGDMHYTRLQLLLGDVVGRGVDRWATQGLAGQHYRGHGNSNLHEDQGQLEDEDEEVGVLLASCRKNGGQLYLILFYRGGSVEFTRFNIESKIYREFHNCPIEVPW